MKGMNMTAYERYDFILCVASEPPNEAPVRLPLAGSKDGTGLTLTPYNLTITARFCIVR